jgi:hypothetical protein
MLNLVANMVKEIAVLAHNSGWRSTMPCYFSFNAIRLIAFLLPPTFPSFHNLPNGGIALRAIPTTASLKKNGLRIALWLRALSYAFVGQKFSGWPERTFVPFSSLNGGKNL